MSTSAKIIKYSETNLEQKDRSPIHVYNQKDTRPIHVHKQKDRSLV